MSWETNLRAGALLSTVLLLGCGESTQPQTTTTPTNQPAAAAPQSKTSAPSAQTKELSGETQSGSVTPTISKSEFQQAAAVRALTNTNAPVEQPPETDDKLPPKELVERADKGDRAAQRDLGKFYTNLGNDAEAHQWYEKAAEQGDAESQRIMGLRYIFGQGVERDMKKAGEWLLRAAEQNDVIAQRELGKIYGEQWKHTESNDWYLKAALQGDAEAQRMLGLRYTIGQGIEPDREEALKWFRMAAEQGDAVSQRELGKYYGEKWQLKESNEWYLKAATQGDIRAQHMMGVRYTFGQGVERDMEEAGKWFLMAAEQGDAQSQFSVGMRWTLGEAGEAADFAEATKWFRLAAEQGLDEAQLSLARRYINGDGGEQDYVEAYKWLQLAQRQGKVKGAETLMKEISVKMTSEQIAAAKKQAESFKPKAPTPIPQPSVPTRF